MGRAVKELRLVLAGRFIEEHSKGASWGRGWGRGSVKVAGLEQFNIT